MDYLKLIGSYAIAIVRLCFWPILVFLLGLQQTLFNRVEIAGVELKGLPLRCDRDGMLDKLSYVDKLCAENPDLASLDPNMLEPHDEDFIDDELPDIDDLDDEDD